jgi:DNA-binding transcriptional regulator YbjK
VEPTSPSSAAPPSAEPPAPGSPPADPGPPDAAPRGAPRAQRARRTPSGEIRAAIVDATIAIIGGGGVAAVTHRAVADEAGVSLSSTTYHFTSKEAIVDEALREVAAREIERVERGLRELQALGSAAPEAFARAIVDWMAGQLEGEGRLAVRAGYHLQLEAVERPALQPILVEWAISVQALAEEALRLAGSPHPRTDARILATAIDGLRLEQLTSPQPGFAERVGPVVERLVVALTAR